MTVILPTVDSLAEKCLPCPTAVFKIVKCRRSAKILDKKSGCGYKGTADVSSAETDPYVENNLTLDKWGNSKWTSTSLKPEMVNKLPNQYSHMSGQGLRTLSSDGTTASPGMESGAGLGKLELLEKEDKVEEQLLMDVVVCLYDRVDPHGMTAWIKNETLTRFMKLYVVQCVNPSLSKDMVNGAFNDMVRNGLVKHKALEVKHITLDTQADLTKYEPIVDPVSGKKAYKIEYTFTFALRSPDVDHLSYFAGCFFDGSEVMAEYGLDSCTIIDSMVCRTSYINVFHKGAKSEDKRIRCGKETEKLIPAVTDTREPEEETEEKLLCKLPYFSGLCISRDCKNNCNFVFGMDYLRIIREKSQYGYLLTTPWVDVANQLLNATLIRNMSIFRVDSEMVAKEAASTILCEGESIKLIPGLGLNVGTTEAESAHHVVQNTRKKFPIGGTNAVLSISSGREVTNPELSPATLPKIVIGTMREISIYYASDLSIPLAFRHFNIADLEIALSRGQGIYQYGLTLKIEDNIHKYLLNKLRTLRKMVEVLKGYYAEAIKPCNYNSYTESFFKHFIELMLDEPDRPTAAQNSILLQPPGAKRWRDPIAAFVDIAKIFFFREYPTLAEIKELINNLLHKLNPYTASPDSILEVIRMFDDALRLLYGQVKEDVTSQGSAFTGASPLTEFAGTVYGPGASPGTHSALTSSEIKNKNIIELDHLFNEKFATSILNNAGFDYLGCDISESGDWKEGFIEYNEDIHRFEDPDPPDMVVGGPLRPIFDQMDPQYMPGYGPYD
jgi:hypothetical protein